MRRRPEAEAVSESAALDDRAVLLRALKTRLRTIAAEATGSIGAPRAGAVLERVRAQVLDCADALDALQDTCGPECVRCHRIGSELTDANAALARSRAELAATRHDERRARHLALHDSLTALPNRLFFSARLDQALSRGGIARPGIAVVYLDVDGLKAVNDRHGHDTGDELLKIVAARLRGALRAQDIVCRLGGDEFACLLTDWMSRPQLEHLACKLLDTVSAPMQIGEQSLVVSASIGIATDPADGTTGAVLLKRADTAMYRAKRERIGHAFFDAPPAGPVAVWPPAQASTGAAAGAMALRRRMVPSRG